MTHTQGFNQRQNSDISSNNNFDNDDLITLQHDSKVINLYYSQLTKYSKRVRDSYLFSDVINRFPQEIQQLQEDSQLMPGNINYFFQLLQQGFNVDDDSNLTYIQCADLLKISKYFEVRKLSFEIDQYIRSRDSDADFAIQMLLHEHGKRRESGESAVGVGGGIEELLSSRIDECLSNGRFKELPAQVAHRVVAKSAADSISSDKLFDVIMSSLGKFCVLFAFLDLQKLSPDRLESLCEAYSHSDESARACFGYLKCNLGLLREVSERKKTLEETNGDLESQIRLLQSQLRDSNEMNNEHQIQRKDLETQVESLQKKFSESEEANNQLLRQVGQLQDKLTSSMKEIADVQKQFSDSKELVSEQKSKMKELESQVSQLQKQLDEIFSIKGEVTAKVESGLYISAEIRLEVNGSSLDTSKSKFIISTRSEKSLGSEAYEKGEQITSLSMKTAAYLCRPGTHFVRCIVFNSNGESTEIVSNAVTTSGSCATFCYEGKPAKVSLCQGKYKLEVWGAKGGDSTGSSCNKSGSDYNRYKVSAVQGGLGGYSRGILDLKGNETVYVYVGGEGRPSGPPEGSRAEGGFPDGGGATTGHYSSDSPTVPGSGGGSTSIRIGSDTDYARVIVAGGGGGASGCSAYTDPGGFGGGQAGGNCSYKSEPQSQGGGTQAGSTRGLGDGVNGDPGKFGLGAAGKHSQRRDSGGGGGGGWYGGGSGGHGRSSWVSSGGGGSGWVFTAASLSKWQRGDPGNKSKFTLSSAHCLTGEACFGGNEEFPRPDGNGNERGHAGNGYAKITPL